jgi:hypothetical protein
MLRPTLSTVTVLWLGLAVGCDKKTAKPIDTTPATTPTATMEPPSPAPAAPSSGNTNYQAGAGAVQNIRQAARRTVAINDMQQLGTFIQQMTAETGKMPSPAEIKEYIRRDAPKIVAAIDDGTILLTGTKNMSGLWAYEVDADKSGGIALVAGTASRLDAAQVKQLLSQN